MRFSLFIAVIKNAKYSKEKSISLTISNRGIT